MRHFALPAAVACLLVACAMPGGGPTPGASASPVPGGASGAPTTGGSASPAAGATAPSALTLVVDDKPIPVGPQTAVKAGDLLGKRISLDYTFGGESATAAQANVTMRFGSAASLWPSFKKSDLNQGYITITYIEPATNLQRSLYFEHTSTPGGCEEIAASGADGRVMGSYTCSAAKPRPGNIPAVKLRFTYDLAQPAFKP